MSFMEAEKTERQLWLSIDGNCGTDFIPADLIDVESVRAIIEGEEDSEYANKVLAIVKDYTENSSAYSAELLEGWGVRSSAPGYMDCTQWSVYTNEEEANEAYATEEEENNPTTDDDEEKSE